MPIRISGLHTVVPQRWQPSDGLDGVKKDEQMVIGRKLKNVIEPNEVRFIRLAQIVMRVIGASCYIGREGLDPIGSYGILVGRVIVAGTSHVDPTQGIESVRFAIGEVILRILLGQPSHQSLRRIADHEKRSPILINQVAVVLTELQRINRRTGALRAGPAADCHNNKKPHKRVAKHQLSARCH